MAILNRVGLSQRPVTLIFTALAMMSYATVSSATFSSAKTVTCSKDGTIAPQTIKLDQVDLLPPTYSVDHIIDKCTLLPTNANTPGALVIDATDTPSPLAAFLLLASQWVKFTDGFISPGCAIVYKGLPTSDAEDDDTCEWRMRTHIHIGGNTFGLDAAVQIYGSFPKGSTITVTSNKFTMSNPNSLLASQSGYAGIAAILMGDNGMRRFEVCTAAVVWISFNTIHVSQDLIPNMPWANVIAQINPVKLKKLSVYHIECNKVIYTFNGTVRCTDFVASTKELLAGGSLPTTIKDIALGISITWKYVKDNSCIEWTSTGTVLASVIYTKLGANVFTIAGDGASTTSGEHVIPVNPLTKKIEKLTDLMFCTALPTPAPTTTVVTTTAPPVFNPCVDYGYSHTHVVPKKRGYAIEGQSSDTTTGFTVHWCAGYGDCSIEWSSNKGVGAVIAFGATWKGTKKLVGRYNYWTTDGSLKVDWDADDETTDLYFCYNGPTTTTPKPTTTKTTTTTSTTTRTTTTTPTTTTTRTTTTTPTTTTTTPTTTTTTPTTTTTTPTTTTTTPTTTEETTLPVITEATSTATEPTLESSTFATSTVPASTTVPGSCTCDCSTLGFKFSFTTIVLPGVYWDSKTGFGIRWWFGLSSTHIRWSSNATVNAVIVRGAVNSAIATYPGGADSGAIDTSGILGAQFYVLLEFCYDPTPMPTTPFPTEPSTTTSTTLTTTTASTTVGPTTPACTGCPTVPTCIGIFFLFPIYLAAEAVFNISSNDVACDKGMALILPPIITDGKGPCKVVVGNNSFVSGDPTNPVMSIGQCQISNNSVFNVTNNTLSTSNGPCMVDFGTMSLINKGSFFFQKNFLLGESPQLQFADVNAADTCKMIVDHNVMKCLGGPCSNAFFWFKSAIALTGAAEFSISNNNCTGIDMSFEPLLVLVSSLITPCFSCTFHFCFNNMFGKLLDSSEALKGVVSVILSALMINCVGDGMDTPVPLPSGVSSPLHRGAALLLAAVMLATVVANLW